MRPCHETQRLKCFIILLTWHVIFNFPCYDPCNPIFVQYVLDMKSWILSWAYMEAQLELVNFSVLFYKYTHIDKSVSIMKFNSISHEIKYIYNIGFLLWRMDICQRWRRLSLTFSITITLSISKVGEKNETDISKRSLIYGKEKSTLNQTKKLRIRNEKKTKAIFPSASLMSIICPIVI